MALPDPWLGTVEAAVRLIDDLDRQIDGCEAELRALGADHRYVPLLLTVPGVSWMLAYTIAAEIDDITRFPSRPPDQAGSQVPALALIEAAHHAAQSPPNKERYQLPRGRTPDRPTRR